MANLSQEEFDALIKKLRGYATKNKEFNTSMADLLASVRENVDKRSSYGTPLKEHVNWLENDIGEVQESLWNHRDQDQAIVDLLDELAR